MEFMRWMPFRTKWDKEVYANYPAYSADKMLALFAPQE